ncbi:MAG: hypothetical protein HBSAPP03_23700 [Phycisphaerae bacterium]|nr:MAG: hypothetical protein HBSAPP03_23700 [Phycisphaerae bacterium]
MSITRTLRGGARVGWGRVIAWAIVAGLAGCGSLPDVRPFATATLSMEKSAAAGFEASASAQERMAGLLDVPASHPKAADLHARRDEYMALAKSIREEAVYREKLMRALTDYTDSLAGVVEASANAQGNVDALAASVMNLVGVFQASPLSPVAGGAVDLGKVALRELIRMKATRDLRRALEATDPVVQRAGELLLADVESLRATVAGKRRATESAARQAGGEPYREYRKHLTRLETRELALLKMLNALDKDVDVETNASAADLRAVREQIDAARARLAAVESRAASVKASLADTERLFTGLEEAICAWMDAHAGLVAAAREGGSINTRRLMEVVVEVKGIADRMQAAKE